jgi:predicted N-acetyltransferase YhbS
MKISLATHDDIPQLTERLIELFSLEHEFIPDKQKHQQGLAAIIENPQLGEIFVCKDAQKVVAMITILYSISTALGAKVATFEDMIVAENYRSSGIGSSLIEHALEHVKSNGCKRVSLLTDADNYQAHCFYQRHDFELSTMRLFRQSTA